MHGLEASCNEDGSIIVSEIERRGPVMSGVYGINKLFEIDGRWIETDAGKFTFVSDEMIYIEPEPEKYSVKINSESTSFVCPGFKFSCKMVNASILSCYNHEDEFVSRFFFYNYNIDGKRIYRVNNPYTFFYEITDNIGRTMVNGPFVKSNTFSEFDLTVRKYANGNLYTLRFPTNLSIDRFAMRNKDCKYDDYYIAKECNLARTCLFNEDCDNDEYCSEGFCLSLLCDECQYIENYSCMDHECCISDDCYNDQYCQFNECTDLICAPGHYADEHKCHVKINIEVQKNITVNSSPMINVSFVQEESFWKRLLRIIFFWR